jgi:hypothetical protein
VGRCRRPLTPRTSSWRRTLYSARPRGSTACGSAVSRGRRRVLHLNACPKSSGPVGWVSARALRRKHSPGASSSAWTRYQSSSSPSSRWSYGASCCRSSSRRPWRSRAIALPRPNTNPSRAPSRAPVAPFFLRFWAVSCGSSREGLETAKPPLSRGFRLGSYGADDGARTRDTWLGKPVLYRLSYVRAPRILAFSVRVARGSHEALRCRSRSGATVVHRQGWIPSE